MILFISDRELDSTFRGHFYPFLRSKYNDEVFLYVIKRPFRLRFLSIFNYFFCCIDLLINYRNKFSKIIFFQSWFSLFIPIIFFRSVTFFFIRTISVHPYAPVRVIHDYLTFLTSYMVTSTFVPNNHVASFLNIKKFSLAPVGIPDYFSHLTCSSLSEPRSALRAIYHGSLSSVRDLKFVVDVFANLDPNYFYLTFVGDYSRDRTLFDYVQSLKVSNIQFLGKITHVSLPSLLSNYDVSLCIVPSNHFSVQPPLKLIEALAIGLPCIVSSTAATGDIITPANGVLIDNDFSSLTKALINFNPDTYNSDTVCYSVRSYYYSVIFQSLEHLLESS